KVGQVHINLRGSITFNQDKIINDDMLPQRYPWMEHKGNNILARYGYVAEKLFVDQKEINENPVPGDKTKVMPGDIKYKDLNHDGVIDDFDKTKIGRGDVPSTVYGFGFNISYKNFSIGALFQGIAHADRMLEGAAIMPFNSTDGSNAFAIATDRWTVQNQNPHAF